MAANGRAGDLPPELLEYILGYLPMRHLHVAAFVCRHWREAAEDARARRVLRGEPLPLGEPVLWALEDETSDALLRWELARVQRALLIRDHHCLEIPAKRAGAVLAAAVRQGSTTRLTLLWAAGFRVAVDDNMRKGSLWAAAATSGDVDVAKLLLLYVGKPAFGNLAVHWAVVGGHLAFLRFLEANGVMLRASARSSVQWKAWRISAIEAGHHEVADWIFGKTLSRSGQGY